MLTSLNMPNNLEKVEALIRKYEANKSYYHSQKYNKTLLRSDFLDPLFEALGWDIKNAAGKSISEREVLLEESLRDGMMEHTKKPDYTFRLFSERKFFWKRKSRRSILCKTMVQPNKLEDMALRLD